MFDTYYTVKWDEEGEPHLRSGHPIRTLTKTGVKSSKTRILLDDGTVASFSDCCLNPSTAIEEAILYIASTNARDFCIYRSQRPWLIARMIQKLCHLAKHIRSQEKKNAGTSYRGSTESQ